MSNKVKTAAEIAEENAQRRMSGPVASPEESDGTKTLAEEYLEKAGDYESTRKEDGSVGISQGELQTHVINQDEAGEFDIDKVSDRFDTSTQSFGRIKNVYADGPSVVIEVDEGKIDVKSQAAVLATKRVTPSEALQRAVALNALLGHDKVKMADRKQVEEIVEAAVMACLEAQENVMRAQGSGDEDIKRTRKARIDRIEAFEKAVENKRGKKDLQQLQEMLLFKRVLKKLKN